MRFITITYNKESHRMKRVMMVDVTLLSSFELGRSLVVNVSEMFVEVTFSLCRKFAFIAGQCRIQATLVGQVMSNVWLVLVSTSALVTRIRQHRTDLFC